LTFAPAELVVVPVEAGVLAVVVAEVLALVLLVLELLLPQPATPIRTTARLGMRSLERMEPSLSLIHRGLLPRAKVVSLGAVAVQLPG
jgi:hypothetical protein